MNTAKPQKSICGEREQAMRLTIEKYHGLGNDYLVYDPNKNEMALGPEQVKMICDRRTISKDVCRSCIRNVRSCNIKAEISC